MEENSARNVIQLNINNDPRWDAFVTEHPYGWLYHLSGWKRVLDSSFDHMKGYYFAILDQEQAIRAALPVYEVKSVLTGKRLVSIPFATLFDPLVSTSEEFSQLFAIVLGHFDNGSSPRIEIRSQHSPALIQENRLICSRFFKHHYLDLRTPPELLRKKFHRSCIRQRISRAEKSNIQLKTGTEEADLKSYYRLHMRTRKNVGRPTQPYRFFKAIWENFYPVGQLTLLLAEKDSLPIAGMILFKFKERVSAEFAAHDERYRDISPNHFLFWESIKLAHQEGYTVFDFGRTSPTNQSLMEFKKRWGAEVIDLPGFYSIGQHGKDPAQEGVSRKLKLMSKVCQMAPKPLQQLVGSFCYHHLG